MISMTTCAPELVRRDGDPNCFSNKDETGIPALQKWCHEITLGPRERVVKKFLCHFATFLQQVSSYVSNVEDASGNIQDRITLRDRWTQRKQGEGNTCISERLQRVRTLVFPLSSPDCYAAQTLSDVTNRDVEGLRERFRTELADKCRTGADNAEKDALDTSDKFAKSTHWQTYRASGPSNFSIPYFRADTFQLFVDWGNSKVI
jgi:hypothetical protein